MSLSKHFGSSRFCKSGNQIHPMTDFSPSPCFSATPSCVTSFNSPPSQCLPQPFVALHRDICCWSQALESVPKKEKKVSPLQSLDRWQILPHAHQSSFTPRPAVSHNGLQDLRRWLHLESGFPCHRAALMGEEKHSCTSDPWVLSAAARWKNSLPSTHPITSFHLPFPFLAK